MGAKFIITLHLYKLHYIYKKNIDKKLTHYHILVQHTFNILHFGENFRDSADNIRQSTMKERKLRPICA